MHTRVLNVDPSGPPSVGETVAEAGITVDTVSAIADCLANLDQVDGIVTVETLTDGTAVDLCTAVRDRGCSIPIIVSPVDGSERLAAAVIAAGADGYVPSGGGLDGAIPQLRQLLDREVTEPGDRSPTRDRFTTLFENVPDAVLDVSYRGGEPTVEAVNPAFERVFGYDASEIVGNPVDEYIVPSNRRSEANRLYDRGRRGDVVDAEVKRRTATGLRDLNVRTVPVETAADAVRLFLVYTDLTDQKQRQKRVEVLNRVLRHDLRNGMNIIGGCAEMLAAAVDDESAAMYADVIDERVDDLVGLAEKTRAVERTIDHNRTTDGPIELASTVDHAIARIERSFPEARFDAHVPPETFVAGDELLETAIYHVFENAVEHNDTHRPHVRVELVPADGDLLTLAIVDNGPGIPREERALLEEDQEITQLRHASGLGLWLVDWVVTQAGGRLSFGENEPRGTVVSLSLPRASPVASTLMGDGTVPSD